MSYRWNTGLRFIICFFWILLSGAIHAVYSQPVCAEERYVEDIFSVQLLQEPEVYAIAPDIPPVYLGENNTTPQDLSFDFYQPQGDTLAQRPLVIMSFGGAFLGGDKRQAELVAYCEALTRKGFCVASIDYRIHFNVFNTNSSIRAVYRGLQDFKAAIRFFRHNANIYGIDPNHIFGGGNSAGAINAIHAAYVDDDDRTVNSVFAATFASSNAPDLGCVDCSGNSLTESSLPNGVVNLWGGMGDTIWIESGEAPIISFHGLDDTTVSPNTASPFGFPIFPPLSGSIPMHERASTKGLTNEVILYDGEGHELWNDQVIADEIVSESADFLLQLFSPATPHISGSTLVCQDSVSKYFIDQPKVGSRYCWEAQGGTILLDADTCITVQWTDANLGSVQVIELNVLNAQSINSNLDVSINDDPIANFSLSFIDNVVIFDNSSEGAVTYHWDFGDGIISNLFGPSHLYDTNGIYTVTLVATNACGDESTFSRTVEQQCQPDLMILDNPTPSGVYQAFNSVSSNKSLELDANVQFRAGQFINLNNGFETNTNSVFEIFIQECVNE